jgi:uncharacterized LabA/DUF88 family protein
LIKVKYFTARVNHPQDKSRRQSQYLEAIQTLQKTEIIYGNYSTNIVLCKQCGQTHLESKEKMTDVNMAINLIADVIENVYDVALVITADSYLVPAIKLAKKINPEKKIVVFFPPERSSVNLAKVADVTRSIFENRIAKSIFPDVVLRQDGFELKRPPEWI